MRKYASFIFRGIFQTTISSKGTSFGGAWGYQEDFDPQGRINAATNGKDAKARGYTSETKSREEMRAYKRYKSLHALWKSRWRRRLESEKLWS